MLTVCRQAGLAKLGHVALDGTKVQANASRHKAMSHERMCSEEKRLREVVRGWLREAERIDAEEDELYGKDKSGDELPSWVTDAKERSRRLKEAREALEREAREEAEKLREKDPKKMGSREREVRRTGKPAKKAQRNFTDPDSRIMRKDRTYLQAYNCQAAVDAGSQVIVARRVSNRQNDAEHLIPILDQIRANLKGQTSELSADAGYCSEKNLKELRRRRIRRYVATGRQQHRSGCPDPARDWQSPWIRAMTTRLRRGGFRSRYRLRKQVVEPVFGQIQECLGFRRMLLRGLESVQAEWSLVCTAHNLRKLWAVAR